MTRGATARPPWWALASSFAAPVFLIGGWTLAAAVRPDRFDATVKTISDLARIDAPHRWIMTAGLVGLGVAHVVTALGLSVLSRWSRVVLATAGVFTVLVAVFPQPAQGSSSAHGLVAGTAFVLLALWPATTVTRHSAWPRHPVVAVGMSAVSVALLIWFAGHLNGDTVGRWERVLAAQQALWPLVLVVALRTGARMRR